MAGHSSDLFVMRNHGPAQCHETSVGQGDPHPGLRLFPPPCPHPSSGEKTQAHLVSCSTSQVGTIRVRRGIVWWVWWGRERENGLGSVERRISKETRGREQAEMVRKLTLDQRQHTGKQALYSVWAAQQRDPVNESTDEPTPRM